jgi:hypothetical protein
MADKKISALTGATTPLAGTEVLPIVQSGATVKVTVDNLTTGKTTPTNGVQFPATQVASANANCLDDYEEGTWTPVIIGVTTAGTGTYTTQQGIYTKVGNLVTVAGYLAWSAHTGTGETRISGLPFAPNSSQIGSGQAAYLYASDFNAGVGATALMGLPESGGTTIILRGFVNVTTRTNPPMNTSGDIRFSLTYRIE